MKNSDTGMSRKNDKGLSLKEVINIIYMFPMYALFFIMPVIIKLKEYDCGFGGYDWHSEYSVEQDLYCYYRSRVFLIICAAIVLLRIVKMAIAFSKKTGKKEIAGISVLTVAGVLLIIWMLISTDHSIDKHVSVWGNYYSFQGLLVCIGYLVIVAYIYGLQKEKRKHVIDCLYIQLALECIWGYLELFRIDPLRWEIVQSIVLGKEYAGYMGGLTSAFSEGYVSLSFMNPNHAGVYLAMMAAFCFVGFLFEEDKICIRKNGILFILTIPLLFFTYSRGSQIVLFFVCIITVLLFRKKIRKDRRYICYFISVMVMIVALVALDNMFIGRLSDNSN